MQVASHNGKPFNFSPEALTEVQGLMVKYPEGRHKSALIRALHIAQEENGGWLSIAALDHVAETLRITPIEVYEVATFYTMFNLEPVGMYSSFVILALAPLKAPNGYSIMSGKSWVSKQAKLHPMACLP